MPSSYQFPEKRVSTSFSSYRKKGYFCRRCEGLCWGKYIYNDGTQSQMAQQQRGILLAEYQIIQIDQGINAVPFFLRWSL